MTSSQILRVSLRYTHKHIGLQVEKLKTRKLFERLGRTLGDKDSMVDHFVLDFDAPVSIRSKDGEKECVTWFVPEHVLDGRMSVSLPPGSLLELGLPIAVKEDYEFVVQGCLASNDDGIGSECGHTIRVLASETANSRGDFEVVSALYISGCDRWQTMRVGLERFVGKQIFVSVECCASDDAQPGISGVALSEISIARSDKLPLFRAQTFRKLRSQNEIDHFSKVYSHSVYSRQQDKQAKEALGGHRPVKTLKSELSSRSGSRNLKSWNFPPPDEGEVSFSYGNRLLAQNIRQRSPDFDSRLREMASERDKVRILSLCSGAARVEAAMSRSAPQNVSWALLDMNPGLLEMASTQFHDSVDLELFNEDANQLNPVDASWDIIICVSALHHIVELERIFEFIGGSLTDGGEFWSLGENIGRNGNRLWPDALQEGNRVFQQLPDELRINVHTGNVDDVIPDRDFSVGCFEGIRSEDIEGVLANWLSPIDVYRRNCFMWRILDLSYSENYDLSRGDHVRHLQAVVDAELRFYNSGGRATELFGVYRKSM